MKTLNIHIQNLNYAFRQSQNSLHTVAIIADSRVKKSNIVSAITHIWTNNSVMEQFCIQAMNIMSVKAELMSICISLIPAIDSVSWKVTYCLWLGWRYIQKGLISKVQIVTKDIVKSKV